MTDLNTILAENDKPIPRGTKVELRVGEREGTVGLSIRLPGQSTPVDYPSLPIIDGILRLPLRMVFLCHAKEDSAFAGELARRLLRDGIVAWFDEENLLPGDDWMNQIEDALDKSARVIVLLSSASTQKVGYVQTELRHALARQELRPSGARFVLPVKLDACDVPGALGDLHWVSTAVPNWYDRLRVACEGP